MSRSVESRRTVLERGVLAAAALGVMACTGQLACSESRQLDRPNVVIVYFDDLGYGDLGSYGGTTWTPSLDAMATNGMRFTRFYAPSTVCSPSRAGLLTGSYPQRLSVDRAFFPADTQGLHPDVATIADQLDPLGYTSMCVGKWHLGHRFQNLPNQFGFDDFFGLPYSNDMWPLGNLGEPNAKRAEEYPPLRLYTYDVPGESIDSYEKQGQLTGRMTRRAVRFIEENKDRPFLLYLAHPMPHVPLNASPRFRGSTAQGLYADVIRELDWSVGQIRDSLRESGIDEKTLLIVTSDNGPWLQYGDWGGSPGHLREGKLTTFEGGQRVPCLMEMPGTIPAGSHYDQTVSGIDIMPTVCALTGAALPEQPIDGEDILHIIRGETEAASPHEYFYYYGPEHGDLQAISKGRWKLHLRHDFHQTDGMARPGNGAYAIGTPASIGPALFDLETDPGERRDIRLEHPELVEELTKEGQRFDQELKGNKRPLG